MSAPLITLAAPAEALLEVKGSRFRASAARLDDPAGAPAWPAAHGVPDATHNAWAWRCGAAYRFSDDGEPGGTAGRPILMAIDGQALDRVIVLVTRWFGGVKLGTGGLVRAYGGAAAACLREAEQLEVRPKVHLAVTSPFDVAGALFTALERLDAMSVVRDEESWSDEGLTLYLTVDAEDHERLARVLTDATRGAVTVTAREVV